MSKTYKIEINAPVEYVCGDLRDGYYTGTLELSEEEYQNFSENPFEFLYSDDRLENLTLNISDYEICDVGSIYDVNWKVKNS